MVRGDSGRTVPVNRHPVLHSELSLLLRVKVHVDLVAHARFQGRQVFAAGHVSFIRTDGILRLEG